MQSVTQALRTTAKLWPTLAAGLLVLALPKPGVCEVLRGKVVMEDGSPPGKPIAIERFCDTGTQQVAVSDRKGVFVWSMEINPMTNVACVLRATLSGYESSVIEISSFNWFRDPNLPPLVLRHGSGGDNTDLNIFRQSGVPLAARGAWDSSAKAGRAKNWAEAERHLRAVVQAAPGFASGWYALGYTYAQLHKTKEAQESLRHAVERNPRMPSAYLLLVRVSMEAGDWQSAIDAANALSKADPKNPYPEIYTHLAIARYHLKDLDGAEGSITEGIRLDRKGEFPRNEYVLGVIQEAKHNYEAARVHLSKYLQLEPKGPDAEDVIARIQNLGKAGATPAALAPEPSVQNPLVAAGEAWVPGGRRALAAVAHLAEVPSYADFFPKYCRAIADESSVGSSRGIPAYADSVREYLATIANLTPLGESRDGGAVITLSLATEAGRKQSERVLQLLGWRLTQNKDGSFSTEPGNQPIDGLRQQIPAALGIDEISLQQAIETGREFQFEIPTENARLLGGDEWNRLLRGVATLPPGGMAGVLATDIQLAKTCAGLGTMGPETAAAVISAIGMRNLATRYADLLSRYGGAFALAAQGVAAPGGADAEPVWRKLAGVSPRDPPAFFRALAEKQQGKLAAFYFTLWTADPAHQRFFTATPQRAERFFAWYRDAEELRYGPARLMEGWRTEFFRKLPLDNDGHVRFPGGKRAWSAAVQPDEDVLLASQAIEALIPLSQIEDQRKRPLDEASARLLALHYPEWRPLFPYFASLSSLGAEEFAALAAFADAVAEYPPPEQNAVVGEWSSLVELMDRGVKSGALDSPAAARAFRRASLDLLAPDHFTKALDSLRAMAGGEPNLSDAVAGNLLRLTGSRRAAFDRVLELQNVPRIDAPGAHAPAETLTALSGYVYAASLDPDMLLLNQDSRLLSKHRFLAAMPNEKRPTLFAESALVRPRDSAEAYLSGGFGNFGEVARRMARSAPAAPLLGSAASQPFHAPAVETEASAIQTDFQATARLVEVYATVTDGRGKYIDDLTADQFTLMEQGNSLRFTGFEPQASEVSCVLLLDTTGSMVSALPALKNAALRLIGDLRPADAVAVYSFSDTVTELQQLTTDKASAKRAVLRTRAMGNTALYDALTRVSQDLAGLGGKKVIVVFTDGKDNASTVTSQRMITQAKAAGVPVYTIAEGEALGEPALIAQLAGISKATGGEAFVIRNPGEIGRVFEKVSEDLSHGYLLSFPPPPAENNDWRTIEVRVRPKGAKVRAREGYFPQE